MFGHRTQGERVQLALEGPLEVLPSGLPISEDEDASTTLSVKHIDNAPGRLRTSSLWHLQEVSVRLHYDCADSVSSDEADQMMLVEG